MDLRHFLRLCLRRLSCETETRWTVARPPSVVWTKKGRGSWVPVSRSPSAPRCSPMFWSCYACAPESCCRGSRKTGCPWMTEGSVLNCLPWGTQVESRPATNQLLSAHPANNNTYITTLPRTPVRPRCAPHPPPPTTLYIIEGQWTTELYCWGRSSRHQGRPYSTTWRAWRIFRWQYLVFLQWHVSVAIIIKILLAIRAKYWKLYQKNTFHLETLLNIQCSDQLLLELRMKNFHPIVWSFLQPEED